MAGQEGVRQRFIEAEVETIRKIFLDPKAQHLIMTTTHGENFYLHSRSTKPRHVSRFKGVFLECVSWSPALPATLTRKILLGTQDVSVYETVIKADGQPVTGLWVDMVPGKPELRRVITTTIDMFMHWVGRVPRFGPSQIGAIFTKFFETEAPRKRIPLFYNFNFLLVEYTNFLCLGVLSFAPGTIKYFRDASTPYSGLSVTPESADDSEPERQFAWLTPAGVYHGNFLGSPPTSELGAHVISMSKLLP
ncbi:tethering complex subunit [Rhizina undulata]